LSAGGRLNRYDSRQPQVADLLEDWPDAPWTPGFREGAAVQAVCDAMEACAAPWPVGDDQRGDQRR